MSSRRILLCCFVVLLVLGAGSAFADSSSQSSISKAQRERSQTLFRRLGFLGPNTPLSRCSVNRQPSEARTSQVHVQSSLVQANATGLTFQFTGFTAAQTSDFQSYLSTAYALMVQVYGEPAPSQRGRVVRVIYDAEASDGVYDEPLPGASNGGTIRLAPVDTAYFDGDPNPTAHARDFNNFLLTVLALNAFHGNQLFDYDSWELGFSHAAALIVTYKAKNQPAGFDPAYYSGYLLPLYDLFNRPNLAGKLHYAPGGAINLNFYRNGMAQAAWLKVWVENSNFFKNFNAAYYQQAGDMSALRAIAAAQLPSGIVEGLPFEYWYSRQTVLDTAIPAGEKLWMGLWPYPNYVSGDTRSVFFAPVERYRTNADGSEKAPGVATQGTVAAFNEAGINITQLSDELKKDAKVYFDALGESELNLQDTDIVGFATTSTAQPPPPNQSRVSIVVNTSVSQTSTYFPFNVAGTVVRPSGFFGVMLGTNEGKVKAVSNGVAIGAQVDLKRGAFGIPSDYPTGAAVKTVFTITPTSGAAVNVIRNSCWIKADPQLLGGLVVALEAAPGPPLRISDAQLLEGDSGTRNLAFTVSLDSPSTKLVSVAYSTANPAQGAPAALAGSDYTRTTGTLSLAAGEISKQILVPIIGDTIVETGETFSVNLSSATNAIIGKAQAQGTIVDDDTPRTLTINNVSVNEGTAALPGEATFTITLSGPSGKTVSVSYNTVDNTALASQDYKSRTGIITFLPGQTSRTFKVIFVGDSVVEADETFFVDLKTPVNATIADSRGLATIRNDDGTSLAISNAPTIDEDSSGTRAQTFTVHLAPASTQTVKVGWSTAYDSASSADFVAAAGTLTFAPGETTKTIVVQVKGDLLVEPTEGYKVNLKTPINAVIVDAQATAYIRNDDAAAANAIKAEPFEDEPSQ